MKKDLKCFGTQGSIHLKRLPHAVLKAVDLNVESTCLHLHWLRWRCHTTNILDLRYQEEAKKERQN